MSLADLIKTADGSKTLEVRIFTSEEFMKVVDEMANMKLAMEKQLEAEKKKMAEYLTTSEVCKLLKVSQTTLLRWRNSGYLVPAKAGGKCFYSSIRIYELLNERP